MAFFRFAMTWFTLAISSLPAGGVYVLRAIKRTHGMRLITPKWKTQGVRAKALRPIAQKEGQWPLKKP